ncbi:Glutamine--fructose-6-phosphate transaminase [Bacillus cereus R309803]|nr:Glutamine--fructose-6-phosphate transaminase [Bacillus cereus R309803]
MRGPAGVGDAGGAVDVLGAHLLQQLGHAGGAAGALQAGRARGV